MDKILLTGGAGFIGSHIAVALAGKGFTPILIDNFSHSQRHIPGRIEKLAGKKITFYELDCRDHRGLLDIAKKEGPIDGVIHLAAFKAVGESVANPMKYYDNNLGCMNALMRVILEMGIPHFVFSSSCTVYGMPDEGAAVDESSPFGDPYSPYGYTKQACERIMKDVAGLSNGLKQISLRYFNPIGAHPSGKIGELPLGKPNNLVPYMCQAAAGLRSELVVFGRDYPTSDGTCERDYIHVCDLAEAHIRAMEHLLDTDKRLDAFNVGAGKAHSVQEIIHTFSEVNQVELPLVYGDRRPGDVAAIYARVDKAQRVLGWKTRYSVRDALQHAWQWQLRLQEE